MKKIRNMVWLLIVGFFIAKSFLPTVLTDAILNKVPMTPIIIVVVVISILGMGGKKRKRGRTGTMYDDYM